MKIDKRLEEISVEEDLFPELSSTEKAINKDISEAIRENCNKISELQEQNKFIESLDLTKPVDQDTWLRICETPLWKHYTLLVSIIQNTFPGAENFDTSGDCILFDLFGFRLKISYSCCGVIVDTSWYEKDYGEPQLHLSDAQISMKERKELSAQICKNADENGLWVFKKNSTLQKKWEKNVVSQVKYDMIDFLRFWYLPYIMRGSYSLWDYNGDVYGILKDRCETEIKLGKDFVPIKMSEYYTIMEEAESSDM